MVTLGPVSGAEDEGALDLDAGLDVEGHGEDGAVVPHLVVHEEAPIGIVDVLDLLHGARGETYLATCESAALADLDVEPGPLDRIRPIDRHVGMLHRGSRA